MSKPISPIHIFGISHPNFSQRYGYIRKSLAAATSYPWEIVGVDGSAMAREPEFSNRGHKKDLSPGQIGCALAHCKAYSRMEELGLQAAMVIEDDVKLPDQFDKLIEQITKEIRPGEVISLHNPMMEKNSFSSFSAQVVLGMRLLYPMSPRSIRSASAYVITIDAARNILRANDPVQHLADHWDAFYDKGLVTTYRILHPTPFRWLPFDSSIGYGGYKGVRAWLKGNPMINSMVRLRRRYIFWRRLQNVHLVNEASPLEP